MKALKRIKKIIYLFALTYLCLVAVLYLAQRSMIYFPSKIAPDVSKYQSLNVQAVQILSRDNHKLTMWYRPADGDKETFVFFHGNASGHDNNLYMALPYMEAGYGFFSVGYPGYGGNEGAPSEAGLYDAARSGLQYLIHSAGIAEEKIILYGQSIGTGVAVQMATELQRINTLILESPYTSLSDVAAPRYFFVPVRLLMKDRFENLQKINGIQAPLMVIQGMQDKIIPPALGQKLFDKAEAEKTMIQFEQHGHNDLPIDKMGEKVISALEKSGE